jgi:hypothetical protein
VANVVFNETRSISGPGIQQARVDVANVVMNGDEASGANRPQTASTDARVPASESRTYDSAAQAVQTARSQRATGYDSSGGSYHFNLRGNANIGAFQGHPMNTNNGPFQNSFPTPGLPASGVYINTYQ